MNQVDMSNKALYAMIVELEDKFVKLKRMYEDAINNIDENNFATSFVKKIGDMETKINISAEGVTSTVSNELVESMIQQKAGEITLMVNNAKQDMEAQINMAAGDIKASVDGKITDSVAAKVEEMSSNLELTMNGIATRVEKNESDIGDLNADVDDFKTKNYSTVEQTAEAISSKVGMILGKVVDCYGVDVESGTYKDTDNGIETKMNTDSAYHYTNPEGEEMYVYHDGNQWIEITGESIFSCFTQTRDGFKLKGDFTSTTDSGATVDISGTSVKIYQGGDSDVPKLDMGFTPDESFDSNTKYPFIKFGQGDGDESYRENLTGFGLYRGQGIIFKTPNVFGVKYHDKQKGVCGFDIISSMFVDDDGNEEDVGETIINITGGQIRFNGQPIRVTFGG